MNGKYIKSFDGAKIYYNKVDKGSDSWLIFVHGLGGDLTVWKSTRDYFHKLGISTLALDLRGHGLSTRRNNTNFYKIEKFAKDLHLILNKENIKSAITIGHCFGGMISIYFQSHFPNHSQGLVLVNTSYRAPFIGNNIIARIILDEITNLLVKTAPDIKKQGRANYKKFVGTSDLNLKRITSDILHTSLKSYLMVCNQLINFDAEELLKKITVPTLIVKSENDKIFSNKIAIHLKEKIKNSELNLIKEANHIIVLSKPDDLSETIREFLFRNDFFKKEKNNKVRFPNGYSSFKFF